MDVLKSIGLVSLTTLLSLVVLFLLTKLMGAKQVSQMTMFDYVEGITIGSVAAELATNLDAPLNSLTALVLYGLAAVGNLFVDKSFADSPPRSDRQAAGAAGGWCALPGQSEKGEAGHQRVPHVLQNCRVV